MTRGVILFAFNSLKYNYYDMAKYTAKRVNHFLNLPVTLVTDEDSFPKNDDYQWDNVIKVVPDKSNSRDWGQWINKGRYMAYDLSPYDETILLDVDYIVNSDKLLKTFDLYDDFCCHADTQFLMLPGDYPERLSPNSYDNILWATVITFKKTERAKQIFQCLEMIQHNYDHYANLHGFLNAGFRNDFALTLALRIVNGHTLSPKDIIPWKLSHVGKFTQVYSDSSDPTNTEFMIMFDHWNKGKVRKEYMLVKDMDFHVINKDLLVDIING